MPFRKTISSSIDAIIRTKRANGKEASCGPATGESSPIPVRSSSLRGASAVRLRTGVGGNGPGMRSGVRGNRIRRADARSCAASIFLAVLFLPRFAAGTVPDPDPPWLLSDFNVRFVFSLPPQLRYCMVKLPTELEPGHWLASVRASVDGREIPLRVLHVDPRETAVMLNASTVSAGSQVVLYARGGDDPFKPSAEGPLDPAPLFGEVRQVMGQDYPRTWAAHQFQRRSMKEVIKAFRAVSFDHVLRESNLQQIRRDDWRRSSSCIEVSTWVRVTEPGEYRFAVQGENSVFLLWGEEETPVVEKYRATGLPDEEEEHSPWTLGDPVQLQAGVHPLRIVQVSRRVSNARAAWIPPGANQPVEIAGDRLLSGQRRIPTLRRESLRGVIHASFESDLQPGYRFRGVDAVFASVRLRSTSANWMGDPPSHRWQIGGRYAAEGAEFAPVLRSGAHSVTLVSRNAQGFESRSTRSLHVPTVAFEEYRVAGSLQGVPSVCYDTDRIWPDLWVTGSPPPNLPVQARLVVRHRNGRTQTREGEVRLILGWGHLRGEELSVDELDEIVWEILHGDVVLARQNVRFARQPFTVIPDRVFGNELHADGERNVLVVRRASMEAASTLLPAGRLQRVVCLDSTLAPPGWYAGGEEDTFHERLGKLLSNGNGFGSPVVERIVYESLAEDPQGSLRTLAPLAGLRRIRSGDLVVVSLGLEAYVDREPVGSFERRLAALCGLLREAVGADVILVTPPPFENDRNTIRPYAEEVLRVADAYGLMVADVYSAFSGHARPDRLSEGLRVTGEGQALTAGVVMRALRQYWSLRNE